MRAQNEELAKQLAEKGFDLNQGERFSRESRNDRSIR
jgi:hypothetical protein